MILSNGEHWQPTDEDVLAWQQAYQNIDVFQELDAMSCWCEANPSKRKTPRGIKRFVNAWLSRADKSGGSPPQFRSEKKASLRDWDTLDEITHDFMNSEPFRQKMLSEHGRYMSFNGERVYAK
jgi:hypothetical protein